MNWVNLVALVYVGEKSRNALIVYSLLYTIIVIVFFFCMVSNPNPFRVALKILGVLLHSMLLMVLICPPFSESVKWMA